jgi:hypothetical protein
MAVSKNSSSSRRSKVAPGGTTSSGGKGVAVTLLCFAACLTVMAAAAAYFYQTGATLYSGDAEAHLNIARRVIDSRTPGWGQLGTTWLPLPHLLMIPLVRLDWYWRTGLAGAIPSAILMALAGTFLFAAVRRILGNTLPAATAAAVFLLNPNTLYLGSIPMTEPMLYASLFALLYFTVRFADTKGWGALVGAGLAASAGTLTRYEAWFLLPFVAVYIWVHAPGKRWRSALLFSVIAGAGPLLWFAHNWWYFEDPLYFYRGPWSAKSIQGKRSYPGKGDWQVAARYFFEAGRMLAGLPALVIAGAGAIAAMAVARARWALLLLLLPPAFYVWSIHSSGTPIFVPTLEPHSWYNIRYAMAFLPLVALGAAALVRFTANFAKPAAFALVLLSLLPFAIDWKSAPITLQEAEINSRGRREWTAQAVQFLRVATGPHETFFTSFNDMTAIYRTLGVPLKDTLTGDNNPHFWLAEARPSFFLWEDWAVVMGGDTVQTIIDKARLHGPRYELSKRIFVKNQPVIEIYHRQYENPLR